MPSSGKRKTTMAKLNRERRLMERRLEKQAKKAARKHSAAGDVAQSSDAAPTADQTSEPSDDGVAPEEVSIRLP